MIKCSLCRDVGWVCEEHPDQPWAGERPCGSGAPGTPCSACNVPEGGDSARMPDGFEIEDGDERWLN